MKIKNTYSEQRNTPRTINGIKTEHTSNRFTAFIARGVRVEVLNGDILGAFKRAEKIRDIKINVKQLKPKTYGSTKTSKSRRKSND